MSVTMLRVALWDPTTDGSNFTLTEQGCPAVIEVPDQVSDVIAKRAASGPVISAVPSARLRD